jgi:hypothetical protein
VSPEPLAPWMERAPAETRTAAPPKAARIAIPCVGRESARVALAGLRALAANNPALAALLNEATVEEVR